jgi:hypothetical protein
MACWLCKFNNSPECKKIQAYIQENAMTVDVTQMAVAIHEDLLLLDENIQEGIDLDTVIEHLTSHTLYPPLKVGGVLRRLHGLEKTLSTTLSSQDEEGNMVVDGKNVQVYLKVVNEIMQIHKLGIFNDVNKS